MHRLISGGIHRRKSWYAPLWSSQVVDAQPRKRKHAHPSLPTRSLVDSGSAWARCMGSTQLYNLEFVVECLARREVASLVVCTKAKEQRKLLSTLVGNVFWQSCVTRTRARTHARTHTHTHTRGGWPRCNGLRARSRKNENGAGEGSGRYSCNGARVLPCSSVCVTICGLQKLVRMSKCRRSFGTCTFPHAWCQSRLHK